MKATSLFLTACKQFFLSHNEDMFRTENNEI